MFAQGDILFIPIPPSSSTKEPIKNDPDGAIVLARGEVTGHRHAIYGGGAVLFRDDGLARDTGLAIGRLQVTKKKGVELKHEEHSTIHLPAGDYEVRRQREYEAGDARIVED